MQHDRSNAAPNSARRWPLSIALSFVTLAGCGPDHGSTPAAGSQPTAAAATGAATGGAATAGAATANLPADPPAPRAAQVPAAHTTVGSQPDARFEGTPRGAPSTDPFSVIDVEITAPTPFKLRLRVQPELAPDLASTMESNVGGDKGATSFAIRETDGARIVASLKLDRTTFTVAGRTFDVAGKHLQVCGIDLGPLATGDVVTLARGEVRVENVFRSPLPAPVETH